MRKRLLEQLGPRLPLASIDRLVLQRTQHEFSQRYARATVTTTMSYARAIMRAAYASGGSDVTRRRGCADRSCAPVNRTDESVPKTCRLATR